MKNIIYFFRGLLKIIAQPLIGFGLIFVAILMIGGSKDAYERYNYFWLKLFGLENE
jgi:hypothetical protein